MAGGQCTVHRADAVAAEVLHRPQAVAADGGLDRLRHAPHGDAGPGGGDGGLERGARRLHERPVLGAIADVHGERGVHHPAVDVHAEVELGQVALDVDGRVLGRGAVVGGDLVARGLRGEGEAAAAARDLVLDRLADVAQRGARRR